MRMRKLIFPLIFALSLFLALPSAVSAHCPLCVVGAGAGLSLSRVLGIDDSITGVWMAAFLGAMSLWISNSLKKKYIPFQELIIYIVIFATTIISFYRFGLINEHNGLIGNLPKLTFGMITGGILFYAVDKGNALIKKTRGKVLFFYQPIIFSIAAMLFLSIGIYILINYYI